MPYREDVNDFIDDIYDSYTIMGVTIKPSEIVYQTRPLLYKDFCNGYDDMVRMQEEDEEAEQEEC